MVVGILGMSVRKVYLAALSIGLSLKNCLTYSMIISLVSGHKFLKNSIVNPSGP